MDRKLPGPKSLEAAIESVISNIDLLIEILLHVPAKSLIRFKLVSKGWFSLISDPKFRIAHTRRNTHNSPVSNFYFHDYNRNISVSLQGGSKFPSMTCLEPIRQNGHDDIMIVHSCKGLILLLKKRSWVPIVLNPTTQEYKLLPPPWEFRDCQLCHYKYTSEYDILLAFEPLKSHHYKVVILNKNLFRQIDPLCVHIFSSKSESWKEISLTDTLATSSTRRIYWNGAIHWLNGNNYHLQFDVDTEKMIETQLPPKPIILWSEHNQYFGESNGRLFLIQCRQEGALGFRMLEMDRNTHHWSIKHQVNLRPLVLQFPEMYSSQMDTNLFSVLYVKSGTDMKSCSLLIAIPRKVVLYEVKKGKNHTSANVICELPYYSSLSVDHKLSRLLHPLIQCLAPV